MQEGCRRDIELTSSVGQEYNILEIEINTRYCTSGPDFLF